MNPSELLHRHGRRLHSHPHTGTHRHFFAPRSSRIPKEHLPHDDSDHDHADSHEHGHSHGLVDPSIVRSRAGIRAVSLSLGVLALTAGAQVSIFVLSNSVALLADLIHNFGDALTAVPLGIAFF